MSVRLVRTLSRAVVTVLVLICVSTAALVGVPSVANADTAVGNCNGGFWGYLSQSICVTAIMGGKDYSRHTQWVGDVTAAQPDGEVEYLEVWGDGFYRAGRNISLTWGINRQVRSGSGICAAQTDRWGVRLVTCISVKV
jgi:hypothetical protein